MNFLFQIYKSFDMLDVDGSGEIEFDEFYLLITLLIAIKVFLTLPYSRLPEKVILHKQ